MPIAFNIVQQPKGLCFTGNLDDIILKRLTASATTVMMSMFLDNTVYCQDVMFNYDNTGFITIKVCDMVKGLIHYKKPDGSEMQPFPVIVIKLKDESNLSASISTQLIEGKMLPSQYFGEDWWQQNFLTWQPQVITMPRGQEQWLTVAKSDKGPKALRIKTKIYTAEGETQEKVMITITGQGLTYINTSYESLWMRMDDSPLTPIAYDVFGIGLDDPNAPDDSGIPNCPYMQRYVLRPEQLFDQCFIYQNSLGGFDSIMATGASTYMPNGESNTFINNGEESELGGGYVSVWEQDTGYIPDERVARQWREFLNSPNRYFVEKSNTAWIKIVVDEHEVKAKAATLSAYKFKYHLARPDESTFYLREELPPYPRPTKFFN